jgi:hypothetical protein
MNFELEYLLNVIDQLTWDDEAPKYNDFGQVKIQSYELENVVGYDKVRLRVGLVALRDRKLISNGKAFTGFNVGWFATVKGHDVARYQRGLKK